MGAGVAMVLNAMKTNYRRIRTKARQDRPRTYSGRNGDFKRDSHGIDRRAPMPGLNNEDESRPRKRISWWSYD